MPRAALIAGFIDIPNMNMAFSDPVLFPELLANLQPPGDRARPCCQYG
jgi:hypothetical protein